MSSAAKTPEQKKDNRQLPEGWRWARLEDVTTIVNGTTPASMNSDFWDGNIVWVTPVDLGKLDDIFIRGSDRLITESGFKSRNFTLVPPGTVVMSSRAPIGYLGIATIELCTNQGCKSFMPGQEIDSNFLYYSMKNSVWKLQQLGSGSTFSEVSKTQCEKFEIPLPPLKEQERIAKILLKQMAAIYKARTAAQARLEAVNALPASFLRQIFPQKDQVLPTGWHWVKLGEVCEINPRRSIIERDDPTPTSFIPMEAVDAISGTVPDSRMRPYGEVKKGYTFFIEGDVLFAKITPCMQNGKHTIAYGLIDGIGFGTTEFHVLRPTKDVISEIIWFFLRQPNILIKATEHFTGAVGQQRLPKDYLADLEIPLPPLKEQKRIAKMLREQMSAVDKARTAAEEELETINALPQGILRRAFNGEL